MTRKLIPAVVGTVIGLTLGVGVASAASSPTLLSATQMDRVTAAGGGDYGRDGGYERCDNKGMRGHKGKSSGGDTNILSNNFNNNQVNVAALNNISVLSGNGIFGKGSVNQGVWQSNRW